MKPLSLRSVRRTVSGKAMRLLANVTLWLALFVALIIWLRRG
jgi:hypothetical protein